MCNCCGKMCSLGGLSTRNADHDDADDDSDDDKNDGDTQQSYLKLVHMQELW